MGIQEKERDALFDNMKALLIFLVVLGHLIRDFGYDTELGNCLYKIIFSFHMPAFLFVSGYFAKYNPKRFFAKMIPLYVVFQCLHYLLDLVVILLHEGDLSSIHFQMFTPKFTLWYLLALMAYQLLLPVIDTSDFRHRALIFTAAVAAGLLMGLNPDSHNFMAMSGIVTFFPFFLLGYYEKDAQWIRNLRERCHRRMGVVSVILAAALIIVYPSGSLWDCACLDPHPDDVDPRKEDSVFGTDWAKYTAGLPDSCAHCARIVIEFCDRKLADRTHGDDSYPGGGYDLDIV